MNRLALLVLALALSTATAVGNLYWRSMDALPMKASIEKLSIVKVIVMRPDPKTGDVRPAGHGSGVRVRQNAILTCAHVAVDDTLLIEYIDGTHEVGHVVIRQPFADLAVIAVQHPIGGIAQVGETVTVGEPVVAIGHPGGIPWNVTFGIVSYIDEVVTISDTVINGGNSGGGLFNQKMELIGIARAIIGPPPLKAFEGHSVFIPPFKIKAILKKYDRLLREGHLGEDIEAGSVR